VTDADERSLHATHGAVLTAVSDGMVALLKEFYGRGPTQAKTYYYDDLVVCVLRGGFTRVEQTLLDGGRMICEVFVLSPTDLLGDDELAATRLSAPRRPVDLPG
jgi:hypothetical protein